MTINDLDHAQQLLLKVAGYADTQARQIAELKDTLEEYQHFLMEQIHELRNPTVEQSSNIVHKIPIEVQ